jgi:hypothetical protein
MFGFKNGSDAMISNVPEFFRNTPDIGDHYCAVGYFVCGRIVIFPRLHNGIYEVLRVSCQVMLYDLDFSIKIFLVLANKSRNSVCFLIKK